MTEQQSPLASFEIDPFELDVFDPETDEAENVPITEYDLVSTPNDFNVLTIQNFLETGAVKVPKYQRNFVWDRPRASKLIESLILGLPVPQVFLYEEARNSFQIIDGQQRLMSIYFFMVGRFPRKAAKPRLRDFWGIQGAIPNSVLQNDELFEPFKLALPTPDGSPMNPLHGAKYETLGDKKIQLGMRTLRNVIIKQVNPEGRGAVYEIFNRLNTTGVNLTPQEIRMSLADSALMERIIDLNLSENWRKLIGAATPDPKLKDIEIILRVLAMADDSGTYKPSMVRFLNRYADRTRKYDRADVDSRARFFEDFIADVSKIDRTVFLISGRFSVPVFEAIYAAYWQGGGGGVLNEVTLRKLMQDPGFVSATSDKTTDTKNVGERIKLARQHLFGTR
ncbi:DUF262 domain-containing protein [Arthrobacter sp. KN11-1C]|uniref:DUF262 domain-containing protein n=1 Tax=Arthrobacter sp. KN11-1C TaxID=3445774 RepID=UPI003FA094CD